MMVTATNPKKSSQIIFNNSISTILTTSNINLTTTRCCGGLCKHQRVKRWQHNSAYSHFPYGTISYILQKSNTFYHIDNENSEDKIY